MQFVNQTTGLAEALASTLNAALAAHERVIWLIPGGSNVPISVAASRLIEPGLTDKLVLMQTDERYVDYSSSDCNWRQLLEAGLRTAAIGVYPILSTEQRSLTQVVADYQQIVEREFAAADCIVGQFGVGADGHIAGIKPHSPASTSDQLVADYQAEDFTRVTLTFPALLQLAVARTFAHGAAKRPVLERLAGEPTVSLADLPMGILREIVDSIIYNDQVVSEGDSQ